MSLSLTRANGAKTTTTYVVKSSGTVGVDCDYLTVQDAISALPSTGGKIVCKAGSHSINSTTGAILIDKNDVTIEGEGWATKFVVATGSVATALKMSDTTIRRGPFVRNVRFSNNGTQYTGTAIDFSYMSGAHFENVWCEDFLNAIVANAQNTLYCRFDHIRANVGGAGFGVKLDTLVQFNHFTDVRLSLDPSSTATGYYVNARSNTFRDCAVEATTASSSTGTFGWDVTATGHGTRCDGCYIEGVGTGVRLASGVKAFSWSGGFIADCDTHNTSDLGAVQPVWTGVELQYDAWSHSPDQFQQTAAQETLPRRMATAGITATSQTLRLTYFRARRSESITSTRTLTAAVNSGTPTLCRIGIYSVASNGNLTLIGSTANDTALWAGASVSYTKALQAATWLDMGSMYAVGILFVGGTAPTLAGVASVGNSSEYGNAPVPAKSLASQSDLPDTVTAGSLSNTLNNIYTALT